MKIRLQGEERDATVEEVEELREGVNKKKDF